MATNVLVVVDGGRDTLTGQGRELLGLARSLADALGGSVDLIAVGGEATALAADAGAAGADRVCIDDITRQRGYHPEAFAERVIDAARELAARVVLVGHGVLGVDLAPRVAFGLGWRWATQCVAVSVDGDALRCLRNEVGGKVQVVELVDGCAVVTLRPKSVEPATPDAGRVPAILRLTPPAAPGRRTIEFVERHQQAASAADELEAAPIIVTGGLGMGSADAFATLQKLAQALGGALAGSKQAVDRGWIAAERQVGLTGTTVAPKVYLAVGVSGALQHMAGCQTSRTIVAINPDPAAPIFRFARYGVVAKWEEILPELLARLPAR